MAYERRRSEIVASSLFRPGAAAATTIESRLIRWNFSHRLLPFFASPLSLSLRFFSLSILFFIFFIVAFFLDSARRRSLSLSPPFSSRYVREMGALAQQHFVSAILAICLISRKNWSYSIERAIYVILFFLASRRMALQHR